MSLLADLRVLFHLAVAPVRGRTHAERLNSFYGKQAAGYDAFRERLLHGRQELYQQRLPCPAGGVWVDIGGGTGRNLEYLGSGLNRLRQVYIVDLSRALLGKARERIRRQGWTQVETLLGDAAAFALPGGAAADVVTFSYSLTMIPDWFAAIDRAWDLLRPGGVIGVVDFFIGRKYPEPGRARHGWLTRAFWPAWFALDNVFLSPDHVPYLQRRFAPLYLDQRRGRVPYLLGLKAPYYLFVGQKP
jgi:S-adenosylmethionine-diacylgycerolhomoserine-N-methlytransferase